MTAVLPQRATEAAGYRLAAGWYIAASTRSLQRKPLALDLFGRQLVAWRDSAGRPAVMQRHCPHLGASLADGKVVGGSLRCAFHHWQFDGSGSCVAVPGVARIPQTATLRTYPVVERYGYLWAWYGGDSPAYPLPAVPALDAGRDGYLAYRFRHTTPASPRRVLENAFDYYHFMHLHGMRSGEPVTLQLLSDPADTAENGPPIAPQAWMGAVLESKGLHIPRAVRCLGIRADRFHLLVDGWPGGQRLTFLLDDEVIAKELLGITPVAPGRTVMRGWSLVRRSGHRARDAFAYLAYRAQHLQGTLQDLAIYRDTDEQSAPVPVRYDHGVLRFRKHYDSWADRAESAESQRSAAS
ncbi:aromatic ring-hydroxylating dioxygenase subunit alpha [Actinoplanes xinjiangensis]|uniref:Phenylpropionate dioxygenase-like ring-hydroxylating dioxygenase large terminal subunit n=1 Tax=Actinoplanes xinjiangensis TaxID=512350 RepID=A0A316EXE5_9ACTN|nr:aromatic ring-hydroxylating dioxygenase subunit alpha [Actinoplanes xinjiangensis]PWK36029.1 phenylpropionate dioxygenase-like ring-hydroxylating dioxygenase large terminal subunit [Actinoplanes xinjiangensis]GIF42973.1 hypothetical protein Axi01nite_72840 [Actinoplanes xinjiangensis]